MKKRKQRSQKKKKTRRERQQPHIPDPRALEKTMADLERMLQSREFESLEEVNAILGQLLSTAQPIPTSPAETPLQAAQELMYQAWDAQGRDRVSLARAALKKSEDCADAYLLLAEEAARNAAEARDYLEKGVRAGERALGAEMFAEAAGHFWGLLETRPYMRARAGLAQLLWEQGERAEAITHYQELLRLNPNDNQGIRYTLVDCLMAQKRHQELADLLQDYEEEAAASWAYTTALLAFRQEGATSRAEQALQQAFNANGYVPDYLLGIRKLPPQLPDYVGMGDENEAIDYAASAAPAWTETAGALDWLAAADRPAVELTPSQEASPLSDLSDQLVYLTSIDLGDDWETAGGHFPPFNLTHFLAEQEIPKKEHAVIRRCLSVGLGEYYLDIYGYHKFGERPDFLIDERMHEPHIFGYGAMEILGHKRISQHSKLKVCAYLFETIEPDYENGVPYGLLTALGHLAAENSLSRQQFLKGVLALEYQNLGMFHRPIWTEGATTGALVALADWLAACPDMNSEEKTWWAWKLSVKCDSMPHLGKGFATRWLDKEEISAESKLALCRAWLTDDKRFGVPPLEWSLAAALQMGNLTEAKRLIQEAGIDPRQVPLPSPEELPPAVDEEPDPFVRMLRSPQHYFLIPTYLKRLAIPAVVRFGEDLMDVIDAYWGAGDTYDADALGNGVADAIQEFHQQLAPDILRRLVEQGIQHNKATVRKTFYALSMQFYGGELLEQALEDNAKSIRNWAGKKLAQNI